MHLRDLNDDDRTVRFLSPVVEIDLEAIVKGYFVDLSGKRLRKCGVVSAFVIGGTGIILAIGDPPEKRLGRRRLPIPMRAISGVSATEGDALSTAFLVLGNDGSPLIEQSFKGFGRLVVD